MGKKIVNEHDMYALGRGSARNLEKSAKLAREMGISGIQEPDKVAKMKNHDRMAHNANKLQHKLMGLDPEKNFGHLTHPDFGAGFNDFQKEHAASARPTSNMAVENKIVNKRVIRLTESDLHKIVKESVQKVLKEGIRTISIAPRPDEIEVTDMEISTTWNGGIRYTGNIAALRQKYGDDNLRSAFQQAIGMSSKPWQMERLLDNYFKINGKVS